MPGRNYLTFMERHILGQDYQQNDIYSMFGTVDVHVMSIQINVPVFITVA